MNKEEMETLIKEIETTLEEFYKTYWGNWSGDAKTENPGEHVIEADEPVEWEVIDADEDTETK